MFFYSIFQVISEGFFFQIYWSLLTRTFWTRECSIFPPRYGKSWTCDPVGGRPCRWRESAPSPSPAQHRGGKTRRDSGGKFRLWWAGWGERNCCMSRSSSADIAALYGPDEKNKRKNQQMPLEKLEKKNSNTKNKKLEKKTKMKISHTTFPSPLHNFS